MTTRTKRYKVSNENAIRKLLNDTDYDLSYFSECDDSDDNEHYVPPNLSSNIKSDSCK